MPIASVCPQRGHSPSPPRTPLCGPHALHWLTFLKGKDSLAPHVVPLYRLVVP